MTGDHLIVVDCQYDFIEGALACTGGREAVENLIQFINQWSPHVLYTSDWHSPSNGSFKVNGGIWPTHCVVGTKGAELDERFTREITNVLNRPNADNLFLKGKDDLQEEYSAFYGHNMRGEALCDIVSTHVYVGGIATEYCVKETVLSLLHEKHSVSLLIGGLGYVSENDHIKTLRELEKAGVRLIDSMGRDKGFV